MDEKRSFGLGVRRKETELEKWRWQSGKQAEDFRAFSVTEAAADAVAAPNDVAIATPNSNTVCVREIGKGREREVGGSAREREEAALDETKEWKDNSCTVSVPGWNDVVSGEGCGGAYGDPN